MFHVVLLMFSSHLMGCVDPDTMEDSQRPLHERRQAPVSTIGAPGVEGRSLYMDQVLSEVAASDHHVVDRIDGQLRAEIARQRAVQPVPAPARPTPTERLISELAQKDSNEMVRVAVQLDEPGFDFARLGNADGTTRAALVAERQAALAAPQAAAATMLAGHGGVDMQSMWLVNQIVVTLPAGRVAAVTRAPGVRAVLPTSDKGGSLLAYSGLEGRGGMNINAFLDYGFDGNVNGRAGGAQRIGIIEWDNLMARSHVGFADWAGSAPNRVVQVHDCRPGSCALTASDENNTHGTQVSWVAAGSIEQGQDSNFPGAGTASQERRSGIAPEAEIYFYAINGCIDLVSALQEAVSDGVDIVNMSFWVWSTDCMNDYDADCGGVNSAITNATNAGILVVGAAGNEYRSSGNCTMVYPSWRSDVLAVGALNTSSSSYSYPSTTLAGFSSEGGVPIQTISGINQTYAGVDLVAPGYWSYNFTNAPNWYLTSDWILGTSFAAPAVAGSAALLRDEFNERGWWGNNARVLFVNLLAMGDTWDYSTGGDRTSGVSDTSGYGRFNIHRPDSSDLTTPWAWGWRSFVIQDGETHTYSVYTTDPESPLLTQTKWAVTWFEDDLNNVADIVIKLVDTCPAGGGQVTVALDYSYDLRKSISLDQASIGGRCLEMQVIGFDVPPGGRVVYSADYHHSGPHD